MNHLDLRLFTVIGIIGGITLSTACTVLAVLLPWWWLGVAIAGVAGWYSVDLADRLARSYTEWRQACGHDSPSQEGK